MEFLEKEKPQHGISSGETVFGYFAPDKTLQKVTGSKFAEILKNSSWKSQAGYFGDVDEGNWVSSKNKEEVTQQVLSAWKELVGDKYPHPNGYCLSLEKAVKVLKGTPVIYEGEDNFFISGKPYYGQGKWKYYKNLKMEDIFCLPFNGYYPEKLFFSREEILSVCNTNLQFPG
ncbi:MAG: hypothetical protein V4439_02230 [Patescibacteria group bacterium]